MRALMHLDTYMNEVLFYQSNIWNFPNSEVAMANLGVTYMRHGLVGSAIDSWLLAERINSQYDVAQYNLASILKQKGDLPKAREYLAKAVASPMCHFKKQWEDELQKLDHELEHIKESQELNKQILEAEKDPSKKLYIDQLRERLKELETFHVKLEQERQQKLVLVQQEESTLELKKIQLGNVKEQLKPIPVEELVKIRDNNFNIIKNSFFNLLKGGTNENPQGGVPPQGQQGGVDPGSNRSILPFKNP
jgi:tetratricopeptide (TPR) repeat protein